MPKDESEDAPGGSENAPTPEKDEFDDAPGASEMFRKYGLADRDQEFEDFCQKLADRVSAFTITTYRIEEMEAHGNRITIDVLQELAAGERAVRECLRSASLEWIARASAKLQAGDPFYGYGGINLADSFNETATKTMLARAIVDVRKDLKEARARRRSN